MGQRMGGQPAQMPQMQQPQGGAQPVQMPGGAPQQGQQPAMQQPATMKMDFFVQRPGDQEVHTVSDQYVFRTLQAEGMNPVQISPDGTKISLQNGGEVPISDLLGQMGWQVQNMKPIDADTSLVNPMWRAGIESIPDADMKQVYLETQLRRRGIQNPMIHGNGSDWFVFNPNTAQWVALTNSEGMDMSDMAEVGLTGARIAGGAIGGALGSMASPGFGSVLGAGVGGGLADAGSRALLGAFDPAYAEVAGNNMGMMARDVGMNMGVDMATMGALKGVGALAKGMPRFSPVSSTMQGVGGAMQAGGSVMNQASKFADKPFGQEMAAAIGGADAIQTAGYGMQAPSWAWRGAQRGMEKMGGSDAVKKYLGNGYSDFLQRQASKMQTMPRALQSLDNLGGSMTEGARRYGSAILKTGRAAGAGAETMGRGLQGAGNALNQSEPYIWSRLAAEEMMPEDNSYMQPRLPERWVGR